MRTHRVNLAAVAVLASAFAAIPIAVASANPPERAFVPSFVVEKPALLPVGRVVVWTDTALTLAVEGPPPSALVEIPAVDPAAAPPPVAVDAAMVVPGSLRDRALGELVALGAPAWVVAVFDCIGWHESSWQNIRSHRPNADGSYDHGVFQFNDVHWPRLNRLGLDPYVPEHAARFAYVVWRESGFGPWAARLRCGV